jgi:cystathionine beta-lyase/cystathionine gamma-synthase
MKGPATTVIHTAERRAQAASLTTPVYETTTFVFETAEEVRQYNEGKSTKYLYSRYTNPTVEAVERKIALLEGAETAMVLSSGMAASATALLALVKGGDEVICSSAIYGGTFHLLSDLLSRFQVTPRFVTLDELSEPANVLSDRTRLLWFESPNNPTLRCVDIRAVAAACRARGVISVIDNTFATPINQRPIEHGVDLVMESATKYLNGHSDVTAGVLAGSAALVAECARARRLVGTVLDPYPAYALGRSLKTLSLRVSRHNANALVVARWLERESRIARVYYPGLESHPDHAIARRQMSGFSGMICIDLGGGLDRAARFYDRLKIFQRAASLGGPESLCSLPVLTSHTGYSDEDLRKAGVTASMARLSIGLEDPEDLIEDLDQALG